MSAPAFQFYPKQWLGDDKVLAMDWDARAMHMHLMCISWQQQPHCTLPDDDAMIKRWLGNPRKWEVLKNQIFTAWKLVDGRWLQSGLLQQFERQKAYSDSRKAGAKKRWEKEGVEDAHALHMECTSDALQSSSSSSDFVIKTPSRGKRSKREPSPDGMKHSNDSRHIACKEAVRVYWKSKNQDEMPWDGREGKALGMLLGASPDLTPERVTQLLRHRYGSDVNHSDRPGKWLPSLLSYGSGPLDRFGHPLEKGKSIYRNQKTREDINNEKIRVALQKLAEQEIEAAC